MSDSKHVPTEFAGKLEPNYWCRAWNEKRQKYCRARAGSGTDHVGQGRCRHHKGNAPVKHGRYSRVTRPRIRELLDAFENDDTPLDLLPELKLLRALTLDFVERYDEFVDSMYAWHASFERSYQVAFNEWRETVLQRIEKEGWENIEGQDLPSPPDPLDYVTKPRQVLDVSAAAGLVDKIGAMVDRIEKHKQSGSITLETLERTLQAVGVELVKAVRKEVSDESVRSRILAAFELGWATVHITDSERDPARNPLHH